MNDTIQGNVLIIQGGLQPEVKFVSAEKFTKITNDPQLLVDKNEFYTRILIATAGCIGAGVDSPDIYSISRIGFPSSIIDLVQEMGRCRGWIVDYWLIRT